MPAFASPARRAPARTGLLAGLALALLAGSALAEPAVVTSVKPGDGLYEIVAGKELVYVAAAGKRGEAAGRILGLDPVTLAVKQTIELGDDPGFGLGINRRTGTLFATQTRTGSVAVIDLATGKVAAEIKQGDKAHVREVVVDEDADRAYVSVLGRRDAPSEIWILDGAGRKLAGTIGDLPGGVGGLALDAANRRLFATALESNQIHEIDLAAGKLVRSFPSGGKGSINLAYDAAGGRLFVANQESNDLTVLDAKDGTLLATIPTGEGALGVTYDPARNLVFVANRRGGYLSIVDGKELKVLAHVVTGSMPNTVALDPASGRVYVSNKVKTAMRPPRPATAEGGAPAGAAPAPQPVAAAPGAPAAPPAGGPGGPRPAPMIDPYGDTVTLVTP
ncbi:YncE family protein [Ancylobacter lacus]|uniref:YncE family protein n=1 Tax=Ancylobacter lacus TaxID=2579970 RepID=UPI001FEB98A3|nr:YncE family protein [Ancylobacter lacus]